MPESSPCHHVARHCLLLEWVRVGSLRIQVARGAYKLSGWALAQVFSVIHLYTYANYNKNSSRHRSLSITVLEGHGRIELKCWWRYSGGSLPEISFPPYLLKLSSGELPKYCFASPTSLAIFTITS